MKIAVAAAAAVQPRASRSLVDSHTQFLNSDFSLYDVPLLCAVVFISIFVLPSLVFLSDDMEETDAKKKIVKPGKNALTIEEFNGNCTLCHAARPTVRKGCGSAYIESCGLLFLKARACSSLMSVLMLVNGRATLLHGSI